jgi:hypothetical protein
MKLALYAGGLLGIFLLACEYEPEGIFEVDIPKAEAPYFFINLDTPPDTIRLDNELIINFTLDLSGKKLHQFETRFNGVAISHSMKEPNKGEVYIRDFGLSTGLYFLEFEFITSSGSGSLADKLGGEGFSVTIKVPVLVNNDPPNSIETSIVSVENTDGKLLVNWKPYERGDFGYYELEVQYDENQEFQLLGRFYDRAQTQYSEQLYIGGKVAFRLRVFSEEIAVTGQPFIYQGSSVQLLSAEVKDDTLLQLVWSKAAYTSNFEAYIITRKMCSYCYEAIQLEFIDNITDTVYTSNQVPFGGDAIYSLHVLSKQNVSTYQLRQHFWQERKIQSGKSTYPFNSITYRQENNTYYAHDAYTLFRVDGQDLEKKAQIAISSNFDPNIRNPSYSISQDGRQIFISKASLIERLNPMGLTVTETWNTKEIFGYDTPTLIRAVSNNELIIVNTYDSDISLGIIKDINLVDMSSGKLILTIPKYYQNIEISPDGKFLISGIEILEIVEDSLEFRGYLPSFGGYGNSLLWKSSNQAWITDGFRVYLWDFSNMQVLTSFAVTAPLEYAQLDPISGYIGGYTVDYSGYGQASYHWYDPATGKRKKEVLVEQGSYFSYNGLLWSNNGRYLPLKF